MTMSLSCNHQTSLNIGAQNDIDDSNSVFYAFDTTKYFKHKSGFYLSEANDIFQLNTVVIDDSNGVWARRYWLDSLMFWGKFPNKKPIKEILDINSFVKDAVGRFDKDKFRVYYAWATSDGLNRFVIDHADPNTFVSLGEMYGKDKNNVFFGSMKVKNADINSFHVLQHQDSAKDNKHYYYQGERLIKNRK